MTLAKCAPSPSSPAATVNHGSADVRSPTLAATAGIGAKPTTYISQESTVAFRPTCHAQAAQIITVCMIAVHQPSQNPRPADTSTETTADTPTAFRETSPLTIGLS